MAVWLEPAAALPLEACSCPVFAVWTVTGVKPAIGWAVRLALVASRPGDTETLGISQKKKNTWCLKVP